MGFYFPIADKDRDAGREAAERPCHAVQGTLARTGLSEDELVTIFITDDDEQ